MVVIDVAARRQSILEAFNRHSAKPPAYSAVTSPSGQEPSPSTSVLSTPTPLSSPSITSTCSTLPGYSLPQTALMANGSSNKVESCPEAPSAAMLYSPQTLKPHLKALMASPKDQPPPLATIRTIMLHLAESGGASPAQIGAFLAAVSVTGWGEQAEVIAVCAQVMRGKAVQLEWEEGTRVEDRCDIVGTGGDGHDTFNVSTTAAMVAAGAGIKVCKHGNRASSSASGSADLLLALDVPLTSLPPASIPSLSSSLPFTFLFAPLYHPSLAALAPLRKELGFSTVFNLLGPLINPAQPERMVVGVARRSLGRCYAEALGLLGVKRAWVVCGREGLDEISPEGETDVWDLDATDVGPGGVATITEKVVSPAAFGLQPHKLQSVSGGSPDDNASLLRKLLAAKPTDELTYEQAAVKDFVLLNAAAVVVVSGKTEDLEEAVDIARQALESGQAKKALDGFRDGARKAVEAIGGF